LVGWLGCTQRGAGTPWSSTPNTTNMIKRFSHVNLPAFQWRGREKTVGRCHIKEVSFVWVSFVFPFSREYGVGFLVASCRCFGGCGFAVMGRGYDFLCAGCAVGPIPEGLGAACFSLGLWRRFLTDMLKRPKPGCGAVITEVPWWKDPCFSRTAPLKRRFAPK